MSPADFNIIDLIPQRHPMQMIDKLVEADERSASGTLLIKEDNLFTINGFLSESAMVEFIAQTAAAFTGYTNKVKHQPVTEGYIGAVKNLVVHSLPATGTEITSRIEVVNEIVGFTIINGYVKQGDKLLASCEMRILGA
jgi:predicted hotdog family 3-hydroxylacyl-ACP dehydratase